MAIHEEFQHKVSSTSKHNVSPIPITLQAKLPTKQHAPWWQVYVMTTLFLVAILVPAIIVNTTESKIVEAFAIMIFYGGLLRWVHKHEAALNREYYENSHDNQDRQH